MSLTANPLYATGAPVVVAASAVASTSTPAAGPGYLHSIHVTLPPGAVTCGPGSVTITDGPAGPKLATIPANFPGGDLPAFKSKRFATSLVAVGAAGSPELTLGISI